MYRGAAKEHSTDELAQNHSQNGSRWGDALKAEDVFSNWMWVDV